MAPKELRTLRILIEHPAGLYGSEFVHKSKGYLPRGTIYALLARLVGKGFVREVEEPPTSEHQLARTRHHITAEGRRAHDAFLEEQELQVVPFATAGT